MSDTKDDNLDGEKLSFEDALKELETIVATLERGEVSLDAAISAFERGTELKTFCQARLEDARLKVEKIKVPDSGEPPIEVSPLDPNNLQS